MRISLYHCAHGADHVTRVPINAYEDLDEWVHESGRLLVIGQAAHPIAVSRPIALRCDRA